LKTQQEEWEGIHSNSQWGKWPRDSLMYFIAGISPVADARNIRVLDLGCGNGASIWPLLWQGYDCYGIDISESAIQNSKTFLNRLAKMRELPEPHLTVGSLTALPYEDNFFHIVTDTCTVQHIPYADLPGVIKEIARVLSPKSMFFSVYRAKNSWIEPNAPHVYTLNKDELTEFLNPYFNILSLESEGFTSGNEQIVTMHYVIKAVKKGENGL
jgi:SAM-dependent methyltransferase